MRSSEQSRQTSERKMRDEELSRELVGIRALEPGEVQYENDTLPPRRTKQLLSE